jgi:eukaryotic-like serine/threonine-protein kinase
MPVTDPERWKRLSPLLDELLDQPPAQRGPALARAAQAHPDLAQELATLLEGAQAASHERFLTGTAEPEAAAAPTLAGQRLGAYTLEAPLGQGGAGSVWLARRDDGRFTGQVAIKLLHLSLVGRAGAERFQREGDVLARLTHPHIARLLDAGVAPGGQPYLVIELVRGMRIDQHCQLRRLPLPARLALFEHVVDAVAHAHSHLVIHRDIKPANVLVDNEGRVKLLDFGIAKLLDGSSPAAEATALTREAGRVLTPAYAAPEQLQGLAITTATDVHGLGLLLYQLLTGRSPPQRRPGHELPPPSQAIADAAERRQAEGDLDTIVQRALKAQPGERYATANAMAQDLRRWREGMPVLARPDSVGYRMRKWVLRNRAATAVAAGVLLALVGGAYAQVAVVLALAVGALLALWQARTARAQAARALQAQQRAEDVKQFIASIFSEARPREGSGGAVTALDLLRSATERIESELADSPEMAAELGVLVAASCERLGDVAAARAALGAALPRCLGTFGPLHPLSLQARCLDVGVAHNESNTDYTATVMGALVADLRQAQPPQHRLLAEALREQSFLLAKHEKQVESLASVQEAVDIARQHLGPVDHETMAALGLLANTYQHFGRMDEAVAATEALVQVSREAFGAQRPHTVLNENERLHAFSLILAFRPADAEPLARQVMNDAARLDPEPTQRFLMTQSQLAMALSGQGRYAEGIALQQAVVAQHARLYPNGNWETVYFGWRLATMWLALRRVADLSPLLDAQDAYWAQRQGESLMLRVRRLRARAELELWAGQLEAGRARAQSLLAHADTEKTEPPRVLRVLARAARLNAEPGAVAWAEQALAWPRPAHQAPDEAACLSELGLALADAGHWAEAASALARAQSAFDRAQVLPQTALRCDASLGQARVALHHGDRSRAAELLRGVCEAWNTHHPGSPWHLQARWWQAQATGSADAAELAALQAALADTPFPALRREAEAQGRG